MKSLSTISNNVSKGKPISLLVTFLFFIAIFQILILPCQSLSFNIIQSTNNSTTKGNHKNYQFVKAIDVATSVYIKTQEWRDYLNSFKIIFPVPTCASSEFPSIFNFSSTVLNCCYENNALYPWPLIHEKAGQMLVDTLKKQYKIELSVNFVKVNTTVLGYFNALKKSVDDGDCDVAIASTNIDNTRVTQSHFQCAYGSSYNAFLRSELDPQIHIDNETALNQPGVLVAVYKTTTYDNWATKNLPLATIVRFSGGYYEAWPMILNKQVHAVITDGADLLSWLDLNKASCSTCKVGLFGESFSYGSFVTSLFENPQVSNGRKVEYGMSLVIIVIAVIGMFVF